MNTTLSQQQLLGLMVPLLKSDGRIYYKFKKIKATRAQGGERIETHTADGPETVNTANKGDYIIENQTAAGERYIISPEKFAARYQLETDLGNGQGIYLPTGRISGLEMTPAIAEKLGLNLPTSFEASWGESMVLKEGDYLVCPLEYNEIYRIARQEFFETYRAEEK